MTITLLYLLFAAVFLSPPPGSVAGSQKTLSQATSTYLRGLEARGRFGEAAELTESLSRQAEQHSELALAASYDYLACQYRFRIKQYSRALDAGIRSRDRALGIRQWRLASVASFGIASVYVETANYPLALETARQMIAWAERGRMAETLEQRLLFGNILLRSKFPREAMDQFRLALNESEQIAVDRPAEALKVAAVRDQIGFLALDAKDYQVAERQFVEAYRVRLLLGKSHADWSYSSLSRLRLEQQRWEECIRLATLGIESAAADFPVYKLLFRRAQARLKLDRAPEAFHDLQQAAHLIRAMRLHLPFGDALQVSGEGTFQEIYSTLVEVAAKLYNDTGQNRYLDAAFTAALDNRAASLRTRTEAVAAWRERLPQEYWTKLAQIRRTEIQMVRTSQSANSSAPSLRAELAAMESLANPGLPGLEQPGLAALRKAARDGELLIAFQLGDTVSYRFVLSRRALELRRLPPRSLISSAVHRLRRLIEENHQSQLDDSAALYRLLFEGVKDSPQALWTIIPDETLFQVPFAALVTAAGPRPVFLIERHPLQLAPTLVFGNPGAQSRHSMLLVGDPVSNRADPRFTPALGSPTIAAGTIELPRLAGSGVELERCGRVWTLGPSHSLSGAAITVETLRSALSSNPAVLHLATHVYQPPDTASPVITLGLNPTSGWGVLTDSDVSALPAPPFVTMSGCGSGQGKLAPGSGLLGLTRAWLMAGSHAVVASLWPVIDDQGTLFEGYYRSLQNLTEPSANRRAAHALANAQRAAIAETGSNRHIGQWAAYFVMGVL